MGKFTITVHDIPGGGIKADIDPNPDKMQEMLTKGYTPTMAEYLGMKMMTVLKDAVFADKKAQDLNKRDSGLIL